MISDEEGTVELPFLSRFSQGAAVFPQAIAASTWTLPSVSSLMTGMYPWGHKVSAFGSSHLDPTIPTLASRLGRVGYSTTLISANALVGPRNNLSSGFERSYVALWWEQYLRVPRPLPSFRESGPNDRPGKSTDRTRSPRYTPLLRRGMRLALRNPRVLERLNGLAQHLREPGTPPSLSVSPWIEPVFWDVLSKTPRKQPLLCVVHLNDAHEPYYRSRSTVSGAPQRPQATARQDYMSHIEGRWQPSTQELTALHSLYKGMVLELDQRVGHLLQLLAETRDLDRALVVITADHGQAFGEGGWLFHMNSPEEALLRIPMIVRFPGSEMTGRGTGWVSLIDVVPTVLQAAGLPLDPTLVGHPFQSLLASPRPDPVWALGDGLPHQHLQHIVSFAGPTAQGALASSWLAAYMGSSKFLYDLTSRQLTSHPARVPRTASTATSDRGVNGDIAAVRAGIDNIEEGILRVKAGSRSPGVTERLDSWGYGV